MVTVAFLHMKIIIDPLMWAIFEQNCVKLIVFFYFAHTDAIALTVGLHILIVSSMLANFHEVQR